MSKKIPIKVNPDTIVRTVFQIRFRLNIPESELLGHLYPILIGRFPKLEQKNPGIPTALMRLDPQLKYLSNFSFSNSEFTVSVGSHAMTFELSAGYKGWKDFYSNIESVLKETDRLQIFERTDRLGLRYLNLIDNGKSIAEIVDFGLAFNFSEDFRESNAVLKKEFSSEGIQIVLNISENASLKDVRNNINRKGILIDLDVSKTSDLPRVGSQLLPLISKLHEKEKFVFFNILKQEFINSLNPAY